MKRLLFVLLCLFACETELKDDEKNVKYENDRLKHDIRQLGFSTYGMVDLGDGVLVEDHININKSVLQNPRRKKQYVSDFLVSKDKINDVKINLDNLPSEWENIFKNVISEYNDLKNSINTRINMRVVTGDEKKDIQVTYGIDTYYGPPRTIAIMSETDGGIGPAIHIRDWDAENMNALEKQYLASDLLGHAIGIRHSNSLDINMDGIYDDAETDSMYVSRITVYVGFGRYVKRPRANSFGGIFYYVGLNHLSGTPLIDRFSQFNKPLAGNRKGPYSTEWTGFSYYDRIMFQMLYPRYIQLKNPGVKDVVPSELEKWVNENKWRDAILMASMEEGLPYVEVEYVKDDFKLKVDVMSEHQPQDELVQFNFPMKIYDDKKNFIGQHLIRFFLENDTWILEEESSFYFQKDQTYFIEFLTDEIPTSIKESVKLIFSKVYEEGI